MIQTSTTPYVLAADIGGSHITTAICDTKSSTILQESIARISVSSKDSAENILGAWRRSFKQSLNGSRLAISGLGIAMPGPFDYEKGISYITGLDKFDAIYGLDIKQRLADSLEVDSSMIRFRNDAEAAIAGEVWANYGKQYRNIIGITLGTGFGSAHYIDGATKDVNWGSCKFKSTIADDYLSTRWFLKRYAELTGKQIPEVKDLAALAKTDAKAKEVFNEFTVNLGDFLDGQIILLEPEALVICGNIAKASAHFLPGLQARFKNIKIELAVLGENAALFGVACLF